MLVAARAEPVWREFEAAFGVPVLEAYGMTEAAHQMASNPLPPADRRPHTVGIATGVEIAVLDETGTRSRPGETGEVVGARRRRDRRLSRQPEANAASFRDGWFRTGDRGTCRRTDTSRSTGASRS